MPYTRAWDESQPAGTALANTLDTIAQNIKTDFRERIAGIFGLTPVEFAADPIVPKTLALSGGLSAASFTGPVVGNASSATSAASLTTPRTINGVNFDGTANIVIAAAAGTLTGAALAAGVTASSLTSLGVLTALSVNGNVSISGDLVLTQAISRVIPGVTSWTLRNNGDTADNLIITNAGAATIRAGLIISAGGLNLTGAQNIVINGNGVVGSRQPGWATQTGGGLTRADMGAGPSLATVGTTLEALINDLRAHGLI